MKGWKQKYLLEMGMCVCMCVFPIYSDQNIVSKQCESSESCDFDAEATILRQWSPLGFAYKLECTCLSAFGKG